MHISGSGSLWLDSWLCSSQREACKWNVFHHPSSARRLDWYRRWSLKASMERVCAMNGDISSSNFACIKAKCLHDVSQHDTEVRVFYPVLSCFIMLNHCLWAHSGLIDLHDSSRSKWASESIFSWGFGSRAGVSRGCVRSMLRQSEQLQLLISRLPPWGLTGAGEMDRNG